MSYVVLAIQPGIVIPCDIYEPKGKSSAPDSRLVLYINEDGKGRGTLIALFAAAIKSSIHELVCEDILVSYEEIVLNEVYAHHPWNFVLRILKVCHLPQVAVMVCAGT